VKLWFFTSIVLLILLSVVAVRWTPATPDERIEGLDMLLSVVPTAEGDACIGLGEYEAWFDSLDVSGDGVADAADASADPRLADAIAQLTDRADLDGNRRIEWGEAEDLFRFLDRDGDDALTPDDMPEEPPIEIVWCSDDNPVRREQIRLFNRLHPGYRIRLDPQNVGVEKVVVQSLAGVGPDIFDCYTGYQLSAYVRAGIALDLTDLLASAGLDMGPETIWPSLQPIYLLDDRVYAHPMNAGSPAVWFNKRLFDEAGEPYPEPDWTWDDCIATAQRLTVRNERGQVTQYGLLGPWDWKLALFQHGARVYNEEMTRCILDAPEAIAAIQFMYDLIFKHNVMPSLQAETAMASAGGWGTGMLALFGAERGAMAIGGRWWLCIYRIEEYAALRLGAVEVPGLELPDGSVSRRVYGYGRSTVVNSQGKRVDDALLFIRYLHGQPYNELVNRQADALAPVIEYNYTDDFLHNPDYPEEDYNDVWRSSMAAAEPEEVSPYVNGQVVERFLTVQMDMVRSDIKSPADAMRDCTRRINDEIIDTLRHDPELYARYMEAVAAGAQPAWDDPEDAP